MICISSRTRLNHKNWCQLCTAVRLVERMVFRCFKLHFPREVDGEETKSLSIARKEWLSVILRTRDMIPELKQRIDENTIFLCERHFN